MYVLITHSCGVIDDVRAFSESDKAYEAAFEAIKKLLPEEKVDWLRSMWESVDPYITVYLDKFQACNVRYCVEHWGDMADLVSNGMPDEVHLFEIEVE